MNKQEAIRILGETKLCSPLGQACFVGIEALEKQIPKKPLYAEHDLNYFECVSCGESIYSSDSLKTHKFCLNCGQALDWRNEDE